MNQELEDIKKIMMGPFISALEGILIMHDKKKFEEWGGNRCRQTAVVGCYALTRLLPDYEFTAWEAEFNDVLNGKEVVYEHAWIMGKDKAGQRYLIDLARTHKPNIFMEVPSNNYPKGLQGYEDMKIGARKRLDWELLLKDTEYLTGLTGEVLAENTCQIMSHMLRKLE